MKYLILISTISVCVGCGTSNIKSTEASGDIFVSKNNFLEFPFYKEIDELDSIPSESKCSSEECNEFTFSNKFYLRAVLLGEENYANLLTGLWSGGDCVSDQWLTDIDGNFSSHYPLDGGMYKWAGNYFFKGTTYVEDGADSKGGKEWNEAQLYYVPANELLIYKGTKSFDSYNDDGSINYTYYKGPDFYYFRRCG